MAMRGFLIVQKTLSPFDNYIAFTSRISHFGGNNLQTVLLKQIS